MGSEAVDAEVRVLVAGEGVRRFLAEVEVDAADGHVHRGQPPGGGIGWDERGMSVIRRGTPLRGSGRLGMKHRALPCPGFRVPPPFAVTVDAVGVEEVEEAAGAHRRIIDAALIGLDHFHDEADDAIFIPNAICIPNGVGGDSEG